MTRMNWDRARRERAATYGSTVGWLAPPGHVGQQGSDTSSMTSRWTPTTTPAEPFTADIGDRVTVRLPDGELETYTLVDRYRESKDELDVVSPLGWALWDAKEGDIAEYDAPGGTYRVTVIDIVK